MTEVITIIYTSYNQCIPVNHSVPPLAARQEGPPPNPMEVPRAARSGVYVDRAAPKRCRVACPIFKRLRKNWNPNPAAPRPQDPTKSRSTTTIRPANEGPDLLIVKVSATTTKLKWRQNYHVTSAILQHFIIWFHIPVDVPQCAQLCSKWGIVVYGTCAL